jgi:hypothetical protein
MTNYSIDKAESAEFVVKAHKQKGSASLWITTIKAEKSEDASAAIAITGLSESIQTRIYFEGWLTI